VYTIILAILGAGLVLGFAFWEKAQDIEDEAETNNTEGSSATAMKVNLLSLLSCYLYSTDCLSDIFGDYPTNK
jgi:hypothetical protein